jgi:hypothetical protein
LLIYLIYLNIIKGYMNKIITTAMLLIVMTGCAGYYSQHKQYVTDQKTMYSFDGEDRNFNLSSIPDDEDIGSQEIISFES